MKADGNSRIIFSIYREKKSHPISREWVKCVTRTRVRKTRVGILRIAEKIYIEAKQTRQSTEIIRYQA